VPIEFINTTIRPCDCTSCYILEHQTNPQLRRVTCLDESGVKTPTILKNQSFAYCIVCPLHYGVEETQNGLKGMIPQRDSDSFVIRDSSR
jgi:hypothetical protein